MKSYEEILCRMHRIATSLFFFTSSFLQRSSEIKCRTKVVLWWYKVCTLESVWNLATLQRNTFLQKHVLILKESQWKYIYIIWKFIYIIIWSLYIYMIWKFITVVSKNKFSCVASITFQGYKTQREYFFVYYLNLEFKLQ